MASAESSSVSDGSGPLVMGGANADLSSSVVTVTFTRLGGTKREMIVDTTYKCSDFMTELAGLFELEASKMKVVCSGKMLKHNSDKPLSDFKVKRAAKIILMTKPKALSSSSSKASATASATAALSSPSDSTTLASSSSSSSASSAASGVSLSEDSKSEDHLGALDKLDEIRRAAEALAKRSDDGFEWHSQHYMEITNQYGERVEMDEASRKGMTTGMVLHSKAKKYMSGELRNFEMAALLCELAFESFHKTVQQKWLDITDNYGMVALDRVWLYFLMKDDSKMMDAFKWLTIAQNSLEKSHGRHLERLKAIRGGDSFLPELAMYVRLDILRGMNSLMTGDVDQAEVFCDRARRTLRKLSVNESDLAELMSMDFTIKEARRGLRACQSDKSRAVEYILRMREESAERARQERERVMQRRKQRMLGLTKSGKFVDLKLLSALQEMGVEEEIAVETLRQVDNHYEMAMDLVLDPSKKEMVAQTLVDRAMDTVSDEQVQSLTEFGYTESRVRAAFVLRNGDYDAALDLISDPSVSETAQLGRLEERLLALVMARALQREQEKLERERIERMKSEASAAAVSEDTSAMDAAADGDGSVDQLMVDEDRVVSSSVDPSLLSSVATAVADAVGAAAMDDGGDVEMVDASAPDVGAFPNPEKGDASGLDGTGDGQWTEDMEMASGFDRVKHRRDSEKRREDALIDREILDDLEEEDGFDDAHAYLDLDLTDELAAVDQLSVMIVSMK